MTHTADRHTEADNSGLISYIYAFVNFVSAPPMWLYYHFFLWMSPIAEKFKEDMNEKEKEANRKYFNSLFQDKEEGEIDAMLSEEYSTYYHLTRDSSCKRILSFNRDVDECSVQTETQDISSLFEFLQNEVLLAEPEQILLAQYKSARFILRLAQMPNIRHLDLTSLTLSTSKDNIERLKVFFNDLLDCNPQITRITFNLKQAKIFDALVQDKIQQNRQRTMAYKILNLYDTIKLPNLLMSFNRLTCLMMDAYHKTSSKLVQVMEDYQCSKSAEKSSFIEQCKQWMETVKKSFKTEQDCFNSLPTYHEPPAKPTRISQLFSINFFPKERSDSTSTASLSVASELAESPDESWKTESFFYIYEKDSAELRLQKMKEGADRIIQAWKEFNDSIKKIEKIPTSNQLEQTAKEQAIIDIEDLYFCAIFYKGWQRDIKALDFRAERPEETHRIKQYHSDHSTGMVDGEKTKIADVKLLFEEVTRILMNEKFHPIKERNKKTPSSFVELNRSAIYNERRQKQRPMDLEASDKDEKIIKDSVASYFEHCDANVQHANTYFQHADAYVKHIDEVKAGAAELKADVAEIQRLDRIIENKKIFKKIISHNDFSTFKQNHTKRGSKQVDSSDGLQRRFSCAF